MAKQTREEKEADFISSVELLLGFPLMDWQKPWLLEIRRRSLAGQPINFNTINLPRK